VTTCPRCHFKYDLFDHTGGIPRTTGRGSQWNHIVGHCCQIGEEMGQTWRETLIETCLMAATKGYPVKTGKWGNVIPKDYKLMNMAEANVVIKQLHENADFLNLALREA
jgi:hypothetical protein